MRPSCTHVAIFARDIDASVAFYSRYPELGELHRRVDGKVPVVWLGEPDQTRPFVVVLIQSAHEDAADPGPFAHLGYAVASREQVEKLAERGETDGVEVYGPVEGGPVVGYFCMLKDPDGNWVEFSYGQSLGRHMEERA